MKVIKKIYEKIRSGFKIKRIFLFVLIVSFSLFAFIFLGQNPVNAHFIPPSCEVTIEARDKNDVLIPNGGTVYDIDTNPVTISSVATDASGLYNHKAQVRMGMGVWVNLFDCWDADGDGYCDCTDIFPVPDGKCDENPTINVGDFLTDIRIGDLESDSVGEIDQLKIGPFSVGSVISYRASATDRVLPVGNTGCDPADCVSGYSFTIVAAPSSPPVCDISTPISVVVGTAFNIDVSGSSDDVGIAEVRFSSDDSQDGIPTGAWTSWFNWLADDFPNGWDATAKTKSWIFTTTGNKEVWAEVKDSDGLISQCHSDISVFTTNTDPTVTTNSPTIPDYCKYSPEAIELFWNFNDSEDGTIQTAYQLKVTRLSDSALFDSGKKISPTTGVYCQAINFVSPGFIRYDDSYSWEVMAWDSADADSGWVSGLDFSTPPHQYPDADFTLDPASPMIWEQVSFNALGDGACTGSGSKAYGGASITDYSWNFGDGSPVASGSVTTHKYNEGNYTITLTITDSDSFSCFCSQDINVGTTLPKWKEVIPE